MQKNKHAYLIMAHHRLDLLKRLIKALDRPENDVYIHLDIKCKEKMDFDAKHCNIIWIDRMNVRWAGYSQVECELKLIEAAISANKPYQYLHLMTGASYPLKSLDYIEDFFDKHDGFEFIGYADNPEKTYDRVKNWFIFNEVGKPVTVWDNFKIRIRSLYVIAERKLGIDHFLKYNMIYKKGLTYWSITLDCAKYVMQNKKLIRNMLKHSLYGDEVFIQTIVYNSPYYDKVFNVRNEYKGSLFCAGWKECVLEDRKGEVEPNLILDDYNFFSDPNYLFGLKFEGSEGMMLIDKIDREILQK